MPTKRSISGKVERTRGDDVDEYDEEYGEVALPEPHALVGYSAGFSKDYGAVKVNISLTMPCKPNAPSVNKTYKAAKHWVDSKLEKCIDEYNQGLE